MLGEKRLGISFGLALAVAAAILCGCLYQVAYAAPTVTGADYYGNGAVDSTASVDVLSVEGLSQDTIYIQVKKDGRIIGDRVAYQYGMSDNNQGGSTAQGTDRAGVVSLSIKNLNLDGSSTYTVTAFADQNETQALYTGTIYAVYAQLSNGTQQLIGTHTGDASSIAYNPSAKLYINGATYALSSSTPSVEGTKIVYAYNAYTEAESANGTITYVDVKGNVISTTTVAGVTRDASKIVEVPSVVTTEVNGETAYFRTVFFRDKLTFTNPGQLNYTITCKLMGTQAQAQSGYYKAIIRAVDQDGNVVLTDTANISGKYYYTMPSTIYKEVNGQVYTYAINDASAATLAFDTDTSTNGAKTVDVAYTRASADAAETTVTFNLLDGTKGANDAARTLGVTTVKVNAANPTAQPEQSITVNGAKYVIAGTPSKYAYTRGDAGYPVVNVYYLPEGYTPGEGSYTVTVNHVNFLTNEVLKTQSFTSNETDNYDYTFTSEESFDLNGKSYVRLAGQEQAIEHSYYSGIETYTVYYRDVNDTYTSGTVINTIRVVYVPGTTGTTTTTNGGTTTTVIAGTTGTTGTTGAAGATGAAGTGAAGSTAANTAQLNAAGTYNVLDGEGNNQTLTNEAGVDTNTERIDDNETPLAAGANGAGSEAGAAQGVPAWALPAGIGLAAVAAAGIMLYFWKRRSNNNDKNRENA